MSPLLHIRKLSLFLDTLQPLTVFVIIPEILKTLRTVHTGVHIEAEHESLPKLI